jgi:hypothetical protein
MKAESPRLPYGEWPAHNARVDDFAMVRTILAVKGIVGDLAVLIGALPVGDHQGSHTCTVEAAGYHWSFRGSIFDEHPEAPGFIRVWIRSEGDITVRPIEVK